MIGLYDHLPLIIDRLQDQTAGFAKIDALSAIQNDEDVLRNLPGCWVAPGVGMSVDADSWAQTKLEHQSYMIVVCCKSVTDNNIYAEKTLGELALSVIKAFDNFVFTGNGNFEHKLPREAVVYDDGYILQRLRFSVMQSPKEGL
ncbi:MAG: hypothetical protein Q7U57_09745 [Methylovulum sp.]|nr:hypothetical protein [Methylovulum sp.]